ncbi:MAG: choice-of-anchor I family protein, partial [Pseudomonadota bacterium]
MQAIQTKNAWAKARNVLSALFLGASSVALLAACVDNNQPTQPAPPTPVPAPVPPPPPPPPAMTTEVTLSQVGVFETGVFDEGAAEIVAYDAANMQLFVVNSNDVTIDVLDISDPSSPTLTAQIDATLLGGGANSIAVSNDNLAVAIEANNSLDNGLVAIFDTNTLALIRTVEVGSLPDMVTFTPDGTKILVANEGEPNDDLSINPEGTVSIIEVDGTPVDAITVDFTAFNGMEDDLNAAGVRIFLPGATVAEDLEPEFIAISGDSSTAFVALQENNAFATIDIETATVTALTSFGTTDHSLPGNELDASNRDNAINIVNQPVFGMRMPDGIDTFEVDGQTFIITANEGDGREFDTFEEVERVED